MELGAMRVLVGTNAERLALVRELAQHTGRLFFETDTGTLFICDGYHWYSGGLWVFEQDKILVSEDQHPLTTEDGQQIGLEREP